RSARSSLSSAPFPYATLVRSLGCSLALPEVRRSLLALRDLERLRVLGLVRVVRPGVDLQLLGHGPAELVLRQHALDRLLEQPLGVLLQHLTEGLLPQTAGVAAVPVLERLFALVPGEGDLLGVDDDDEVAGVDVRC